MNDKTTPTTNREYKSTVFAMLFKDRDNLLSLYNALNGSNYDSADDITTETAIEESIQECISENILRNFLTANRKEVTKMSIFEYDEEKELKLLREAEFQAGLEQGMERGLEQGRKAMEEQLKNNICNLMETMGISLDQALDLLKIPEDKRKLLFSKDTK